MNESPVWIFLFGSLSVYPFFPLRHVPVMSRLTIPFRRLFFYATMIMLVQGLSYLWLSQRFAFGSAELSWHRKLFMIPYVLLTLRFSKDTSTKTLFMDFFMVGIVMSTIDSAYIICRTLLFDSFVTSPCRTDVLVRTAVIVLIYPPLYLFFSKVLKPIMEIKSGDVWQYITAIPAVFALISIITTMEAFGHEISPVIIAIRLSIIFGSVLVCSLMAIVVRRMEHAIEVEEQAKQAQMLLAVQSEQYAALAKNIESTKAARHDLRHQLTLICAMATEGDIAGVRAFISKYQKSISPERELIVCENYAANSMIAHYIALAETSGVMNLDIKCNLGNECSIEDTDLCVLLGNLFENAIEGCTTVPEASHRKIKLRMETQSSYLFLTVDNTFDGVVHKNGERYLSRKRDGEREGVGLASVSAVVEKYGGSMRVEQADGQFCVSVSLGLCRMQ